MLSYELAHASVEYLFPSVPLSFYDFLGFHVLYRVTIMRDPQTRRSKGVAFVLFIEREAAHTCCRALNNTQVCVR